MPAPNFKSNSSFSSGTNAINLTMPTYAAGDILVACIVGANGTTQTTTPATGQTNLTNNGWARVANSNINMQNLATTANIFMDIWWQRASTGAQTAVAIGDAGDHTLAVVTSFANCIPTGDPWEGGINVTFTTATAQVNSANFICSTANTLAICFIAGARDIASAQVNANPLLFNNSDETELTERFDFGTAAGHGSTLALLTYRKPTSGALANVRANTQSAQTAIVWLGALKALPDAKPRVQVVMF